MHIICFFKGVYRLLFLLTESSRTESPPCHSNDFGNPHSAEDRREKICTLSPIVKCLNANLWPIKPVAPVMQIIIDGVKVFRRYL